VCTYLHGETSVRCVENALGITIPSNARLIRNLLMGAQFLHDHIVHFYHLSAQDWVDITSALKTDLPPRLRWQRASCRMPRQSIANSARFLMRCGGSSKLFTCPSVIPEHVRHSWYEGETALQPSSGVTAPQSTTLDTAGRYSWLKTPRYQGEPAEVGPLARIMVAYGLNHPEVKATLDGFLQATGLTLPEMYSTIGRIAAHGALLRSLHCLRRACH
jgi:Ni,Fe-hydrogenase I large subunit